MLPSQYYNSQPDTLYKLVLNVAETLNNFKKKELVNIADVNMSTEGWAVAKAKTQNPRQKSINLISDYNELAKYYYQINNLYKFKRTLIKGSGMTYYNNPLQLLDRLELLGGSINAGNNGVIPEFSEIAHLLTQMSVFTKKQLNELLQNYVLNR